MTNAALHQEGSLFCLPRLLKIRKRAVSAGFKSVSRHLTCPQYMMLFKRCSHGIRREGQRASLRIKVTAFPKPFLFTKGMVTKRKNTTETSFVLAMSDSDTLRSDFSRVSTEKKRAGYMTRYSNQPWEWRRISGMIYTQKLALQEGLPWLRKSENVCQSRWWGLPPL